MKLYLVRHGETDCNLNQVYYGWTDCEMNQTGKKQAEKLKDFFDTIPLSRVISSDLKRAKETAKIILGDKSLPYQEEEGFREINFGDWENRSFQDVMQQDPQNCSDWWNNWQSARIPNGETFYEFYFRVTQSMMTYLQQCNENDNLLLVSHSGPMSCLLCFFAGLGPDGFWKFRPMQQAYSLLSFEGEATIIECINAGC